MCVDVCVSVCVSVCVCECPNNVHPLWPEPYINTVYDCTFGDYPA